MKNQELKNNDNKSKVIEHNGEVHHPLGGASYVWKSNYIDYILEQSSAKSEVRISIGVQPNNTPHFGTLTALSLTFAMAKKIEESGKKTKIIVELVDTAPSEKEVINGITYQKNLANTGVADNYMPQYEELLQKLSSYAGGVEFEFRVQGDLLKYHKKASEIVRKVIKERKRIGSLLSPESKQIVLRASCPKCSLADKHGTKNIYEDNAIHFFCPNHGKHSIDLDKDLQKLEYNVPSRSLLEGLVYQEDNKDKDVPYTWIIVMGSDYAGFYQEQFSYRGPLMLGADINHLPFVVYTPLITDWSGAKLSKSLYIRTGAYNYLTSQDLNYLVDYERFKEKFGGIDSLKTIYDEASLWLDEPYRIFRSYTVYYFDELLKKVQGSKSFWIKKINELKSELGIISERLDGEKEWENKLKSLGNSKEIEEHAKKVIKSIYQLVNKEVPVGLEEMETQMEALIVHQEPMIFGKKVFK